LTLVQGDAAPSKIEVTMGKSFADGSTFFCPYQIRGPGRNKVMAIGGVDAFQAMQLALATIGVELAVINRDSGGKLSWEGDESGKLDFPMPDWATE
jgi:hypothetical protein